MRMNILNELEMPITLDDLLMLGHTYKL